MNKIGTSIRIIGCIVLALGGGNCSKEKPTETARVQIELTLSIDPAIQPYLASANSPTAAASSCDIRWIVEFFSDDLGGTLAERCTWTSSPAPDGHHISATECSLPPAIYKIAVWADHVDSGAASDKFYSTDNLGAIRIPENYTANSDYKDAFVGTQVVDLTAYANKPKAATQLSVTLRRPLARIEVITTDYDKFLDDMAARGITPEQVKIHFAYAGYFPSGFNVYTNKPNDAKTGVYFISSPEQISVNEARLGYDYIFVNGSESGISADLTISHGNTVITRIDGIDIPVVRGKLTTVRGEFLTRAYTPGIGVDPGFDGDIDITIPD